MKEFMSDMRMNFIYFPFTTSIIIAAMVVTFIAGLVYGF